MQPFPCKIVNKSFHSAYAACAADSAGLGGNRQSEPVRTSPGTLIGVWCTGGKRKDGGEMETTVQECIDQYEKEHKAVVIAAGQVVGFITQEDEI